MLSCTKLFSCSCDLVAEGRERGTFSLFPAFDGTASLATRHSIEKGRGRCDRTGHTYAVLLMVDCNGIFTRQNPSMPHAQPTTAAITLGADNMGVYWGRDCPQCKQAQTWTAATRHGICSACYHDGRWIIGVDWAVAAHIVSVTHPPPLSRHDPPRTRCRCFLCALSFLGCV